MLRAIIVDDEYKICQLIHHLGDWEGLGIEVIAMCHDGEEALECIIRDRPDIVLTDIRMPVYDGLEIIRRTREMDIDTSFIVISGYRQFEYAQQALKYGVADFLVKTIDENMLNSALRKAVDELLARRRMENDSQKIVELKEEQGLLIRRHFWENLIDNENKTPIADNNGSFYPCLENDIYQLVLIRTDKPELNMRGSKFSERIIELCREQIKSENGLIIFSRPVGVYLVIEYEDNDRKSIKNQLYSIHRLAEQLTDIFGPFKITFGLSKLIRDSEDLTSAAQTALKAWRARISQSQKELIEYDELNTASESNNIYSPEKELVDIKNAAENFNKEAVIKLIQTLENNIHQLSITSPQFILNLVESVLFSLFSGLYGDNIRYIDKQRNDTLAHLELSNSIQELFMRLRELAVNRMQTHYDEKMAVESLPIRDAKEYMQKNYMNDISLDELAAHIGLSSVYFSRLFKSIEGINYIDYLTDLRMNLAKEYLKNTKNSIKKISMDVGYSDEKYFRKLFKKNTGIKPSEYRKLH